MNDTESEGYISPVMTVLLLIAATFIVAAVIGIIILGLFP